MLKRLLVVFVLTLVFFSLVFAGSIKAEDTDTTVPTSTIGSINGPADVGSTTTTLLVVEDNVCYDLGNGIGSTAIGMMPCTPDTTTTMVDVGKPPVPSHNLPETGGRIQSILVLFGFSVISVVMGGVLIYHSRPRR